MQYYAKNDKVQQLLFFALIINRKIQVQRLVQKFGHTMHRASRGHVII